MMNSSHSQVGKTVFPNRPKQNFSQTVKHFWGVRQKLGTSQSWGLRSSQTF